MYVLTLHKLRHPNSPERPRTFIQILSTPCSNRTQTINARRCQETQPDSMVRSTPCRRLPYPVDARESLPSISLRRIILLQANVGRVEGSRRSSCLLSRVGEGKVGGPGDTDSRDKGLFAIMLAFNAFFSRQSPSRCITHKLKLDRHQSEVDDLNGWPDGIVGLKGRHIHVPQLMGNGTSTTTLGNSHDGEEAGNTC